LCDRLWGSIAAAGVPNDRSLSLALCPEWCLCALGIEARAQHQVNQTVHTRLSDKLALAQFAPQTMGARFLFVGTLTILGPREGRASAN